MDLGLRFCSVGKRDLPSALFLVHLGSTISDPDRL